MQVPRDSLCVKFEVVILFLRYIPRRDPDGQIFAVRKGMNADAEAMLRARAE